MDKAPRHDKHAPAHSSPPASGHHSHHKGKKRRKKVSYGSKKFLLPLLYGALLNILLGFLPTYFIHLNNLSFFPSLFDDRLVPSLLSSIAFALVLYLVLAFLTRRPGLSALFSGVIVLVSLNFGTLNTLCKGLVSSARTAGTLAAILALVIVLLVGFLLYKLRRQEEVFSTFSLILFIVLMCVAILNNFTSKRSHAASDAEAAAAAAAAQEQLMAEMAEMAATTPEPTATPEPTPEAFVFDTSAGSPNFYFFLIDEMGSFNVMEKYYEYDTSNFQAFLKDNHFAISQNSYSKTSHTWGCMADVMYMSNDSEREGSDYSWYRMNPCTSTPLFLSFSNEGYGLYRLTNREEIYYGIPNLVYMEAGSSLGLFSEDGLTAGEVIVQNSILGWLQRNKKATQAELRDDLLTLEEMEALPEYFQLGQWYSNNCSFVVKAFDYFDDPAHYEHEQPHAIFIYLSTTHVPFMFRADGSIIVDNYHNWADPSVYLGAYQFTEARLMRAFNSILTNDPDSIIVLQSDHGIRYHDEIYEVQPFVISEEEERNIVNCVYFRGMELNIEGLSAANTMAVILKLLGRDVDLLDGLHLEDVLPEGTTLEDVLPAQADAIRAEEAAADAAAAEAAANAA